MKIIDIKTRQIEISFINPITIKGQSVKSRPVMVIELTDENGSIGVGEIAPIPYLHIETFDQAADAFKQITPDMLNCNMHLDITPSVANAIDVALFDLSTKQPDFKLDPKGRFIQVNGLLVRGTKNIERWLLDMIDAGFRSIKIKVGDSSIDDDICMVRKLSKIATGRATLRLDANRQWQFEDAVRFINETASQTIEYIEEPLEDITSLPQLIDKSEMPIALDETLVEKGIDYACQISGIKAWILKPSLIGGLTKCRSLAEKASSQNIIPVISAAFPTSISLRAYAIFAARMQLADTAHGLDTLKFLASDTVENPVRIENGCIDAFDLLTEHS